MQLSLALNGAHISLGRSFSLALNGAHISLERSFSLASNGAQFSLSPPCALDDGGIWYATLFMPSNYLITDLFQQLPAVIFLIFTLFS